MLHIRYTRLDTLRLDPANPKDHDLGGLESSLGAFGLAPEVPGVDERTGYLVHGHGRVKALRAMMEAGERPPPQVDLDHDAMWLIPVVYGWESVDDNHARKALVALNAWTEKGGWHMGGLTEMLSELADTPGGLVGVGYDEDDLDRMLSDLDGPLADDGDDDDSVDAFGVLVTCESEGEQRAALEALDLQGYTCRAVNGRFDL